MEYFGILVGTNAEADRINNTFLGKLDKKTEKVFHAAVDGDLTSADIKNIAFAREDLILNIGAKVMITVNDLSGNYVNGTIGIIQKIVDNGEFEESYLVIKTDKGKTVNLYRYSTLFAEYIDAIAVITIDETPTLGTLTVTSAAGTATGDTKITVNPAKENSNNVYKYKVAADAVTVGYGQNLRNWSTWDGKADIKAATGQKITVVECDGTYKALNAGSASVTAK